MVKGFVLVQTEREIASTKEVVTALRQLRGIKSADAVTGPYDIILQVEGQSPEEIGSLVEDKIRFVPGVYRTVTCLVI